MSIRIMLVYDHPMMREGLRSALKRRRSLNIVAEASNGREAVDLALKLKPDVIVMDIMMPESDGISATREIHSKLKDVRIIGLSASSDDDSVRQLLNAGALGFVIKDCICAELLDAVKTVLAGKRYLSPAVMNSFIAGDKPDVKGDDVALLESLTTRQRQVFDLILEGLSTKDIAVRLKIAPKTVSKHREDMQARLHVRNAVELVKYAVRLGIKTV